MQNLDILKFIIIINEILVGVNVDHWKMSKKKGNVIQEKKFILLETQISEDSQDAFFLRDI